MRRQVRERIETNQSSELTLAQSAADTGAKPSPPSPDHLSSVEPLRKSAAASSPSMRQVDAAATRAGYVDRTRRVVRERATQMQARRSRLRSLFIPAAICSSLLLVLASAVWAALESYDLTALGLPDANGQSLVMLVWFLPVTAGVLAIVWSTGFRRANEPQTGLHPEIEVRSSVEVRR